MSRTWTRSDPEALPLNTFERYFSHFPDFVDKALAWKPDFVVPAGKKGCKLLKSCQSLKQISSEVLRYKIFFELNNEPLHGKKISIIDDATQYTSTLEEYRRYFDNQGAIVRTFAFIGHERLFEGRRWQYDEQAEVAVFLPDPLYQEYILQQSNFLLSAGNHFDLDHLIFEANLPSENFNAFLSYLRSRGSLAFTADQFLTKGFKRFSLNQASFFKSVPSLSDPLIKIGPINRIKFNYDEANERLLFSPLVFPTWTFKDAEFGSSVFRKAPFSLPFQVPRSVDVRNKGAVLRTYYNIFFIYAAALAKALMQDVPSDLNLCTNVKIRRNDLDAILGTQRTSSFMKEVLTYVCRTNAEEFALDSSPRPVRKSKTPYKDFGEVLDALKAGYIKKVNKKKTRLGVHYYISYDALFAKYEDKDSLLENLEYYRDLGVIVPETIVNNGRVERVVRTGEPFEDYDWRRTQVLIPLAIEQHQAEFASKSSSIDAMVLNKILSNFVYDYPKDEHLYLHCLVGQPYTFGTLVHADHRHRAPNRPTIYEWEKISPYYKWNEKQKKFLITDRRGMVERIKAVFDERQSVPYSEIVSYFRFCSRLYKEFKNVDVLTMMSICREENYFFSHVLYNMRTWLESYGLYLDRQDIRGKRQALYTSGTDGHSAQEKIRLANGIEGFMKAIPERFGRDVQFVKIVQMIAKNYIPFSTDFRETLRKLEGLTRLQVILTNLSLVVETKKESYNRKLQRLNYAEMLSSVGVTPPDNPSKLDRNDQYYASLVEDLYSKVGVAIDALKAEEPLMATRLQNVARERAANIATIHAYRHKLSQAAFLYLDFSGLRQIPEPKHDVLSRYYTLVEKLAHKRGGVWLYGGKGGDDAYTYLFTEIEAALQCAKDIKKEFSEDLFLHSNERDVKSGLSFVLLPEKGKEPAILNAWGTAKDCCEYKGSRFRNYGDLVISQETVEQLQNSGQGQIVNRFEEISGEAIKGKSSKIFRFKEIAPF